MSQTRSSVTDFTTLAGQLIAEAAAYAAKDQPDAATEGNIRQLRVVTAALQQALQMALMPRTLQ